MQMGIFYLMSKRVLRSIPYGSKPRNRLDMYIPRHHWKNPDVCIPVVIYVTGATILRLWSCPVSKLLCAGRPAFCHAQGQRAGLIYLQMLPAGGAWTIGYKAWGSLLGRRLSKNGVIVCCLDYRNFPQVASTIELLCCISIASVRLRTLRERSEKRSVLQVLHLICYD